MENIVEGIRSRFFGATDENVADEEDVQRKQQKTNLRKDRRSHMEKQRSGSRSRSWGRGSGTSSGGGKVRRFFTSQPSTSYSSDDSTDIDAVVAAAALTVSTRFTADSSTTSSSENSPVSTHTRSRARMAPLTEEHSRSSRRQLDDGAASRALVPSTSMEKRRPATPQHKDSMALVPVPSRKDSKTPDSGSVRWDRQIVPSRSHSFDNKEGSNRVSRSSSGKDREREKESNKHREFSSDRGKREKEEMASAWLEDQLVQLDNRYAKKNNVIQEWEDERRNEADMIFKEIERRLMEKRTKAFEQMQAEVDRVYQKAERKRAKLNGMKETEMAMIIHRADKIRRSGRMPSNCCS